MTRAIQLHIQTPEPMQFQGRGVFRVVIDVVQAVNIDEEIFLHQRTVVDPIQNEYMDQFLAVCSPFDLSIYPANAPDPTQDPPFFRKSQIDFLLPTVDFAQEVTNEVQRQVRSMLDTANQLDQLTPGYTVWEPAEPSTTTTPEP